LHVFEHFFYSVDNFSDLEDHLWMILGKVDSTLKLPQKIELKFCKILNFAKTVIVESIDCDGEVNLIDF
jgi:hypothetical protein